MDTGRTQINGPEHKKIDDGAFYLKDDIDYMCQEKEKGEDSLGLKNAWIHQ